MQDILQMAAESIPPKVELAIRATLRREIELFRTAVANVGYQRIPDIEQLRAMADECGKFVDICTLPELMEMAKQANRLRKGLEEVDASERGGGKES